MVPRRPPRSWNRDHREDKSLDALHAHGLRNRMEFPRVQWHHRQCLRVTECPTGIVSSKRLHWLRQPVDHLPTGCTGRWHRTRAFPIFRVSQCLCLRHLLLHRFPICSLQCLGCLPCYRMHIGRPLPSHTLHGVTRSKRTLLTNGHPAENPLDTTGRTWAGDRLQKREGNIFWYKRTRTSFIEGQHEAMWSRHTMDWGEKREQHPLF